MDQNDEGGFRRKAAEDIAALPGGTVITAVLRSRNRIDRHGCGGDFGNAGILRQILRGAVDGQLGGDQGLLQGVSGLRRHGDGHRILTGLSGRRGAAGET